LEGTNIFDIVVGTLIALLGLKGLFRGFIREFFALFGIVGGVFVASRLSNQVGEAIDQVMNFDNNHSLVLVGFLVTVITFWILAYMLGVVLSKVFDISGLNIFDRLFGFVFGASKVFLLFSIIIFAVSQIEVINTKLENKLSNSIIFPLLKDTGSYIIKLDTTKLESGVSKYVNKAIESTKEAVEEISTDMIKEKVSKIEDNITQEIENIKE
jgi:membrane protein required for colicin V production